ncbi:MAG: YlxR family protein [Cyanobacteria bacterium SIG31]|nr:YlxR family protein [Cyanobacteria bacterium SIG31]
MQNKRKCVACGALKPREDMIKITKVSSTGELVVNPNSKTFGRSAYLCYNQSCVDQALKKKKINRALKINASVDLKGQLDGQFKS